MAEKLKLGICGICDKTQLFYRDPKTKRTVFTDDYAEFSFTLSDGFVYRHAVCKSCIVGLTPKKVEAVIERIKANWADEMVGWASDKQFVKMRSSELRAFDIDERKTLEKDKQVREKEHTEKLERAKQVKKEK